MNKRLAFIEFITQVSSDFINLDTSKIDDAINKALEFVTQFTSVERGYVFLLNSDREALELTHEWCVEGVLPHKGILESFRVSDFQDFVDSLERGETAQVNAAYIPRTPENQSMNDILDLLEIKSFINIPMVVSHKFIGYIGFDATTEQRGWADEVVNAFNLTGETIANTLERKRAEEQIRAALTEKEVLLKEIHHRVKNNLQIVSSLLNLQSQSFTGSQVFPIFEESQNRIRSMALIHEQLYQSEDLARIDFAQYIRDLVCSLFNSYHAQAVGIIPQFDVDLIFLDIDNAIPCGLIINELVSNVLKHAFPDRTAGEIHIAMHQTTDNQVALTIQDDGVGLPESVDFQKTQSLGLQLVNDLVFSS